MGCLCLLIKEAMFANCILFATFCSLGTLVRRRNIWGYSARKAMAFGLLMADIPVYVSCKFEMYIFKIALVISENVCIAFLFVLSIINNKCTHQLPNSYSTSEWFHFAYHSKP